MTTPDGAPQLPPDILAVIDHLVERANAYKSIVTGEPRLQIREIQAFKSELMERTSRWHHDRVTPAAFSAECIAKGLPPENAATLAGHLRSRQAGKGFRPEVPHVKVSAKWVAGASRMVSAWGACATSSWPIG